MVALQIRSTFVLARQRTARHTVDRLDGRSRTSPPCRQRGSRTFSATANRSVVMCCVAGILPMPDERVNRNSGLFQLLLAVGLLMSGDAPTRVAGVPGRTSQPTQSEPDGDVRTNYL
jgi:hypothetical protein